MKGKNKSGPQSILEKKGFYTALYSCIAVVLIMAVGITYSSLSKESGSGSLPQEYAQSNLSPELATRNNAENKPVSQPAERGQAILVEEGNTEDVLPASGQKDKPVTSASVQSSSVANAGGESSALQEGLEPVHETVPVINNSQQPLNLDSNGVKTETSAATQSTEQAQASLTPSSQSEKAESKTETDVLADPVFNTYTGNEDMIWPVAGEVVMEFSIDRLVYDKTLNQYRTNDNICIGANVGEQVKVSADGVVKSITKTREMGNTIVIEHGNGWFTTYSQLQDGILVDEGDVVSEGQVIGGVGEPSIYSTLLGSHLSFKVVKDDSPIDPSVVLALN